MKCNYDAHTPSMNACRSTASALLASILMPTVVEKVREDDENLVINDMKCNYDAHTPSMLTKEGSSAITAAAFALAMNAFSFIAHHLLKRLL